MNIRVQRLSRMTPRKTEGCHEANFVVTGDNCSAASVDKVGTMATLGFKFHYL